MALWCPLLDGRPSTLGWQCEIDGHREAVVGERVPRDLFPQRRVQQRMQSDERGAHVRIAERVEAGREADVREVLGCRAVLVEHDAGVAVGRDRVLRRPRSAAHAPEQEGKQEQPAALIDQAAHRLCLQAECLGTEVGRRVVDIVHHALER